MGKGPEEPRLASVYQGRTPNLILEKEFCLGPGRDQVAGGIPSLWGAGSPCGRTE